MNIEGNLVEVPPMSGIAKGHVLHKIMQVTNTVQDVILTYSARKNEVDDLIKMMNPKVVEAHTSYIACQDVRNDASEMSRMMPMQKVWKPVTVKKSMSQSPQVTPWNDVVVC